MNIVLVTPRQRHRYSGNDVTARRWREILKSLGHRVRISHEFDRADVLIALHARKSHVSVRRFHEAYPDRPLIVALTGTDLYRDLRTSARAIKSLEWATRLVVLQSLGIEALARRFRDKARVIHQSVRLPEGLRAMAPAGRGFPVCVIGHLRPVKDPFRAAMAVRGLPASSGIRVVHVGAAVSDAMADRAHREMARNPRYRWLGARARTSCLRVLKSSRAMVLSSRSEGGANVISEAVMLGIPVIASRIPGTTGLVGEDYPGLFDVGATRQLRELLVRVESDTAFRRCLRASVVKLRPLFRPSAERAAWREVLGEERRNDEGEQKRDQGIEEGI